MIKYLINKKPNYKYEGAMIFIAILVTTVSNLWIIRPENAFVFDDYAWLHQAHFYDFSEIFKILPGGVYNDRPVGAFIIKLLYTIFGFDPERHHIALLFIHLCNVVLLYKFVEKSLKDLNIKEFIYLPLISSVIFGIWPKSIMCIQWNAAIFDLFGATLILLALNLFIDNNLDPKHVEFNSVLIIIFYYLALRTKEMTIAIPLVMICYEFIKHYKNHFNIRKFRPSITSNILITIMILYFILIRILNAKSMITNDISNPYYYTFNPLIMGVNFLKYISLYFDYMNSAFVFEEFTLITLLAIGIFILGVVYAIYLAVFKKKPCIIMIFFSLAISITPVLPMKNMQHVLYLYIPSIFIAILIGLLINTIILKYVNSSRKILIINIIFIIFIYMLNYAPGTIEFREFWISTANNDAMIIQELRKIDKPLPDTTIYIENVPEQYTVFFYGPGFINNILYNDKSLKTVLNPDQIDRSQPFILLDYNSGQLTKIEELLEENVQLEIINTYPNEIFAGELFNQQPGNMSAIAIEGGYFNKNCIVYINDIELATTFGDSHILTALVPSELFIEEGILNIQVKNRESESNVISIIVTKR